MQSYTRGTNRNKKYKKRRRINKVRFSLFILICLLFLGSLTIAIKSLLFPQFPVDISISEDLNPIVGESQFKLTMNWEVVDENEFKNIIVTVNDETFELPVNQEYMVYETTKADTEFEVVVRAKKKGLGFSKTSKQKVSTPLDNSGMYQEVSEFISDETQVKFNHLIHKQTEVKLDLKSLSYDVISASDKVLTTIKPKVVEETKEYVLLEVAVPLEIIKDEYSILFTMNYKANGIENKNAVKDFDMVTNESQVSEISTFKPAFQGQEMVLINQQKEHFEYETHNFYAESLHVSVDLSDQVQTYQLVLNGEVKIDQPYMPEANMGIDLSGLEEGQYLVQFNGLPVYTTDTIYDVWYTIRREGIAKQITVESHMGVLAVTVKNVLQTPDNVYDILIDPGHGGLDTGTAYLDLQEATEVLKLSKYVASRLEDHDLKVKMTRTEDLDPAGEGNFDYAQSPYYNEGRVEQVYRYRANYMMSNHLNSFDKSLSGFEIYSSIISSNDWANTISNSLKSIGREARDSEKNEFRVSEGSYKRYYACTPADVLNPKGCINPYMDFLYIIRETGGQLSQSTTLLEYNSAYKEIPNYGAETILIEYAYLDNPTDNLAWSTNWEKWAEAVVKATVEYLGIPYQK